VRKDDDVGKGDGEAARSDCPDVEDEGCLEDPSLELPAPTANLELA
jgi:hypothetical protein